MKFFRLIAALLTFSVALASALPSVRAEDLLIEDFESGTYEKWTLTGEAFGEAPAEGTLENQMHVSGYRGKRLANTFRGGDASVGTATSEEFVVERPCIAFLIGGGAHKDSVGVELLVDGKPVRSATGSDSEALQWASWNVDELRGKKVRLRIFDQATGGWGHVNVDHLIQTDKAPERFDLEYNLAQYRKRSDYLDEPYRPQFHFSPEINWMNDPNGLVYHNGEYHLFYQYNPAGIVWGHMSWGHAVSRDLAHWRHLPLAIAEQDGVMAFSGSCVVDHKNTSGFGPGEKPPIVAIYTGHGHGKQAQHLAYSNDDGRTWTMYEKNPVLDIGSSEFRDPKVFWHAPSGRWVMILARAAEKVAAIYGSPNLKQWKELSRFGPAGAKNKPNWECPDLFELPIEGEPGRKLWVLEADMGSGSVAGGSGGEYFVGEFDGEKFTAMQTADWVDFGRDFYAPVSWSDVPAEDGRRIWLGWLNNWETCLVPTSPWRSCMSIPRELSLREVPDPSAEGGRRYKLIQRPVKELEKLRTGKIELDCRAATWPPVAVAKSGDLDDMCFVLKATLRPATARSCGFRIRTGDDEFTEIGYDRQPGTVYVDRRKSGVVDFHKAFPGRHEAPTRTIDGAVQLEIVVDRSSVEVFINDGEAVISDRIFPTGRTPVVEAFTGDGSAKIDDAALWPLKSIWKK